MGLEKYDQSSPIFKALAQATNVASLGNPMMKHLLPDAPPEDNIGSQIAWGADAVLGAPRRMLWGPVGDAANAMGMSDETGVAAFDDVIRRTRTHPLGKAFLGASPVGRGIGLIDDYISPEVGDVAVEMLTDPLSLVGGPGKAIGKGMVVAAGRGGGIAETLGRGIWTADDAITGVMGAMATKAVQGAQSSLSPINKALGRWMPSLPAWTELSARTMRASEFGQMLQNRGVDFLDFRDLYDTGQMDTLMWDVPMAMRRDFAGELDEFFNVTANAPDWETATLDYNRHVKKTLGLNGQNKAAKLYDEFQEWWKRQALTSIAYPITNTLGGMIGYAAEGGNPAKIAQDLMANAHNIWNGKAFHIADAEELSRLTDMPIPKGLEQEAGRATASQLGTTVASDAARDAVIMGALGALQQSSEEEGNPLFGFAVGMLGGYGLSRMSTRVQNVSKGIETVLRERGWHQGMSRELIESVADMEGVVRGAMSQPTRPRAGRKTGGTIPSDSLTDWLAKIINDSGGLISRDDINAHLQAKLPRGSKGGGGIRSEVLNAATEAFDDILYGASRAGKTTSEAFNFNYDDLSNIERLVTNVAPFSTWLMKAAPYYLVKAAEHPWAVGLIKDWNVASEEYRGEHGLTSRVSGSLPWHGISPLTEAILGRHTTTFINPIATLIPAGNLAGGLERMEYADSVSGKVMAGMDAVGLGMNPAVGLGARLLGFGDSDDPAQGVPLRAAGTIAGLTGVDLAQPGRALETGLREGIRGDKVTDLGQISAERRVDELALRETGKPIGSPGTQEYLRAKLSKSGPIWDRAKSETSSERGLQAGIGFVNQQVRPQALVTDEEARIRGAGANRLLDRGTSDAIRGLDPMSTASESVVENVRLGLQKISERTGEPIPDNALAILANPTGANLRQLAEDMFEYEKKISPEIAGYSGSGSPERRELQHALSVYYNAALMPQEMEAAAASGGLRGGGAGIKAATGKARDQLLQRYPILSAYLTWKSSNPEGTIDTFIDQYRPIRAAA